VHVEEPGNEVVLIVAPHRDGYSPVSPAYIVKAGGFTTIFRSAILFLLMDMNE
jgi:hypothetical protein